MQSTCHFAGTLLILWLLLLPCHATVRRQGHLLPVAKQSTAENGGKGHEAPMTYDYLTQLTPDCGTAATKSMWCAEMNASYNCNKCRAAGNPNTTHHIFNLSTEQQTLHM
jgi:predicted RNA-binding Zn-ribbon protein involved in translation (DUF1610 family)